MLSASARVPSFSSNIHRERLRQSPGFLSAVRVVDPQLEALVLPVVQQAVGHLVGGEDDRLAGRVLQGLGGGEALLLQLLGQALLYQMKCVEFQTVSLQSS